MSITLPLGFSAASTTAGIKPSGAPDMALVVNNGPEYAAAGIFTQNKVHAAPVKLSREVLKGGTLRAVVYNSGNANACTGQRGLNDAAATQNAVAEKLRADAGQVAVCSTGLIGEYLPMEKIHAGIESMAEAVKAPEARSCEAGSAAARAIMTTDTHPKEAAYESEAGWKIGAMAKGVGMIAPSMATMLCCITTDASVDSAQLQDALSTAAATTFNVVDIDGSTSTNDTVIIMASGASGITPELQEFQRAVHSVCMNIAKQMQGDAEGASKRISITVKGARSDVDALNAARAVGRDQLFKCAMFGSDPNWGRALAAVGMADAEMDGENISVAFNGHTVCEQSAAVDGAREVDLSGENIEVLIDLGTGETGEGTVYTTDLTHAYVEFNSAYTT